MSDRRIRTRSVRPITRKIDPWFTRIDITVRINDGIVRGDTYAACDNVNVCRIGGSDNIIRTRSDAYSSTYTQLDTIRFIRLNRDVLVRATSRISSECCSFRRIYPGRNTNSSAKSANLKCRLEIDVDRDFAIGIEVIYRIIVNN